METNRKLFEKLKSDGKIKTYSEYLELVSNMRLLVIKLESVIKKRYKIKKEVEFDKDPGFRSKVLTFIRNCYLGLPLSESEDVKFKPFFEKVYCRKCHEELEPESESEMESESETGLSSGLEGPSYYCYMCEMYTQPPITAGQQSISHMTGEELINVTGGDYERYGVALSSQIAEIRKRISNKLHEIGIEIEPETLPEVRTQKEMLPWIKRKYAIQFEEKPEMLEEYQKQFEKRIPISILKTEIRKLAGPSVNKISTFLDAMKQYKPDIENIYFKIVELLKTKGDITTNYLNDIQLAVLEWVVNPDATRISIIKKYRLSSKDKQRELKHTMERWVELGIIQKLQKYGGSGPQFNPDFL